MSANGRFVGFTLAAPLTPGDTNNNYDAHIRDLDLGITRRVGKTATLTPNGFVSGYPALSSSGRYVSFVSSSTNLAPGTVGYGNVYVHDLVADTVALVTRPHNGVGDIDGSCSATDISDDLFEGKWEYILRVNDRAQGMGVTTADLAETLRASFYGQEVQRLQRGRHEVKLMVRYPKDERENLATLDSIRVRGNDGVERPIVELAEVSIQRGYQSINRIDQKRAITISGDVRPGGNSTELLNNFEKNDMPAILAKYPAVSVKWEGQRQQNAESMMSLGVGAILAIFAMYLMLVFQMKSLLEPFIILLVIPFAISGAFWGHYAMGLELTLFSFFGIVALTGMVVNDSIVLIDFIDLRIKEFPDEPLIESIVEAGRRRIRPMALNTLTAIIGIVPLVSNKSLQAQVLVPMGVSLVFGLAASTLVGLFLIPTLYYMLAQIFPPHRESDEDYEEQQDTAEVQATNAWGRQSIPGGIPTPENTDAGQTAASTALDAASLLAGLKNGAERTKPLDLPVEIVLAAGPNRP